MIRTKWTLSSFHLYLHISKGTLLYTNEDWLLMKDSPRCLRIKQNKRRSSMGEQPSFLWLHDYLKPSILMQNILFSQRISFFLPSKVWHIFFFGSGHTFESVTFLWRFDIFLKCDSPTKLWHTYLIVIIPLKVWHTLLNVTYPSKCDIPY